MPCSLHGYDYYGYDYYGYYCRRDTHCTAVASSDTSGDGGPTITAAIATLNF